MKLKILVFLFLLLVFRFSLAYVNWQELKVNYYESITKFQPALLATNPFYSLKYFLYSRVINNPEKLWNYLNSLLAQAVLYREQNKELTNYLLNQYLKVLETVKKENKNFDLEKLIDHFFVLSFLEKDIGRYDLTDDLLTLIKPSYLDQLKTLLNKKTDFESFYFLFKLNLIGDDEIKDKIDAWLNEKEFNVIDYVRLLSDKDWQDFKNNSPYDRLTILYLEFLRSLTQ